MGATYDAIGIGYDGGRRTDARIRRRLHDAIGDAGRIIDIGTGTGNYSPNDRFCVGVDPSPVMLAARREAGHRLSLRASAEALPIESRSFDCAVAVLTAHHWTDLHAGLEEMDRASSRQVLFIREPFRSSEDFWLLDYFPSIMDIEATKAYPTADDIAQVLPVSGVENVAVPADCVDGFLGCYWNRPEAFLDDLVRACISIFSFIPIEEQRSGVNRLGDDLDTGRWDAVYGSFRSGRERHLGHRLVVAGV